MIKRFFPVLILLVSCAVTARAQTASIKQGQKLQTVTFSKINLAIEMFGQNIELQNIVTSEVEAKSVTDSGYLFLNTPKRMQTKSNVMGQNIDLDTDRPADMESEAGSILKKEIGATKEFYVNKKGKVTTIVNNKLNATPSLGETFAAMFGEGQAYPLLLILPGPSVKQGDSWVDSTGSSDSIKIATTYTIKAIASSDYIIALSSIMSFIIPTKQQGMDIVMNMSGTYNGDAVYEKATNLLKTANGISQMKGTMSVMGQNAPLTLVSTQSLDVKKL